LEEETMGKDSVTRRPLPTIEDLAAKAHVLDRALLGVITMSRDSTPGVSWEDELLPLYNLALEISVALRQLDKESAELLGSARKAVA
jgi:hypothetical protein